MRSHQIEGPDRFIRFGVNVRFFNIQDTEDMLIDTVGMSTLFLPDLQYHFHGMDPNWVVNHAYNVASYILEYDDPIKDGETVDGVEDGQMSREVQWKCQYEDALIQPARLFWISVWENSRQETVILNRLPMICSWEGSPLPDKNRPLAIFQYLWNHTDESRPAIITEILAYLEAQGIHADRKTVAADIRISRRPAGTSSATGAVRTSTSSETEGWNWRN